MNSVFYLHQQRIGISVECMFFNSLWVVSSFLCINNILKVTCLFNSISGTI
jgi:hypothetical protein